MAGRKKAKATHKDTEGEVAAAVEAFVSVASTARDDGLERVQAAFSTAHERIRSLVPADSPAASTFWHAVALWGTHTRHYKQSWEAFAAAHDAPAVVQHVLTAKVRDTGTRWRPLRNILTFQRAWGPDSYARLCVFAPFPLAPTHNLLEQLAKLSGLKALEEVEGKIADFVTKDTERHLNRATLEKRSQAGELPITSRHVVAFIREITATVPASTTYREPAMREPSEPATTTNPTPASPSSPRHRKDMTSSAPIAAPVASPELLRGGQLELIEEPHSEADGWEDEDEVGAVFPSSSPAPDSPAAIPSFSPPPDPAKTQPPNMQVLPVTPTSPTTVTPPRTVDLTNEENDDEDDDNRNGDTARKRRRIEEIDPQALRDLGPGTMLHSRTLDNLLRRLTLAADPDDFTFYDVGNLEETWRPATSSRAKLTKARNVLVPLCLKRHWILLRFDIRNAQVYLYDSSRRHIPKSLLSRAIALIGNAIWEATSSTYQQHWAPAVVVEVPQQKNGFDCGVCVIVTCLRLIHDQDVTAEHDTHLWRLLLQAFESDAGHVQARTHFAHLVQESSPQALAVLEDNVAAVQDMTQRACAGVETRSQMAKDRAQQLDASIESYRTMLLHHHTVLRRRNVSAEDLDKQLAIQESDWQEQTRRMQAGVDVLEQNTTSLQRISEVVTEFAASTTAKAEEDETRGGDEGDRAQQQQRIADLEKDMAMYVKTVEKVQVVFRELQGVTADIAKIK